MYRPIHQHGSLVTDANCSVWFCHRFDVFNALDIMQNEPLFSDLKFGKGDGQLHYYCYNWRVAKQMQPSDVGLVLM